MKITTRLWIWVSILVILSPLGIILPEYFKAGSAWGEWRTGELCRLVGFIPRGLEGLSGLWSAPIPDYALRSWIGKGLPRLSVAYIISAISGIAITVSIVMIIGKMLTKKDDR